MVMRTNANDSGIRCGNDIDMATWLEPDDERVTTSFGDIAEDKSVTQHGESQCDGAM